MNETTTVPVDQLEGRALDAAVAEEVMGWERCGELEGSYPSFIINSDGHVYVTRHERLEPKWYRPSTDIAAAWEVVEKMRSTGSFPEVRLGADGWYAIHHIRDHHCGHPCFQWGASADSVPLAICRAALKAVRQTE